jgi:O-antigen ligase
MFKSPAAWAQIAAIILAASMTFSPFLLSVGIWMLVAVALWESALLVLKRDGRITWKRVLLFSWQRLASNKAFLALTVLFWIVCISLIWSSDLSFGLERVRIRIPFLVLPWAVANLPRMSIRQYASVIVVLVIVLLLLCLGVWVNFLLDRDTVMTGLGEGQPIPVPRHHIRFSLMMVVALLSGGWLFSKKGYWRSNNERWLFGAALSFLLLFLHFLSVRSAIVALYATTFFTVVRFLYLTQRWKAGLVALLFLIITPIIAIQTVKSLQQRIAYMVYDWQHYQSAGGGESYSDSERFVSLYVGWSIWKSQPVLGSGVGDLEEETKRMTEQLYQEYSETPKLPHNQFIYILASTGLFGLVLSLFSFLYPFFFRVYREKYLFLSFQVVVFISFLVEYTLETSIGTAFYLFYQLWFMQMASTHYDTSPPSGSS